MTDTVYKKVELTGSSTESIEAAVKQAVERASKTVRNMCWFEVVETRGRIADDAVNCWQVTIKVGFKLDA